MKEIKQLQQGDVILRRVDKVAGEVRQRGGRLVLAEGEVTGHAHVIEDDEAQLIRDGERMLLSLEKESVLTHEEHGPVTVPAGVWEVGIVQEYDYFSEMSRKVAD